MLNSTEISKELLSEVTGKEIREFVIENNELRYILEDDTNSISDLHFINIYELAHKCKEWALSKGYYLRAEQGINYYDNLQWTCFLNKNMNDGADYINYWNLTEPEAIINACEWVLKEIKK